MKLGLSFCLSILNNFPPTRKSSAHPWIWALSARNSTTACECFFLPPVCVFILSNYFSVLFLFQTDTRLGTISVPTCNLCLSIASRSTRTTLLSARPVTAWRRFLILAGPNWSPTKDVRFSSCLATTHYRLSVYLSISLYLKKQKHKKEACSLYLKLPTKWASPAVIYLSHHSRDNQKKHE